MENLAVIFDMDGVLIDSAEGHLRSWLIFAKELGCEIPRDRFAETFGRRNEELIPIMFGSHLGPAEIEQFARRKEEIFRDLVRGRLPATPGVAKLIRDCAAGGLKLAVGSSGPRENIELTLAELDVRDLFDAVVSGYDVSRGKPDPEVFELAAERLGIAPSRCVVIEDAPAGVQAAHAGSMAAIALTGQHPRELLTQADLIVDRFDQLSPEIIATLRRR